MPFRFQATDKLDNPDRDEEHEYGLVGNARHSISRNLAREIRLADIMAATSCFPLVFEPFSFPNDFYFEDSSLKETQDVSYALMDGGVVDNQGVDPLYHAEQHLRDKDRSHDFLILSDAGNLNAEEQPKPIRWCRKSPGR